MPRGASPKREREYKELKQEFKQEHRYPGREDEVAARIVNKQRRAHGESKALKARTGRKVHERRQVEQDFLATFRGRVGYTRGFGEPELPCQTKPCPNVPPCDRG